MEEAVAGAVIGATIQVVLQNLLSFPLEEISVFWNFKKDFEKLKDSVVMIRDFLDDAEMKQVTDKPVQRWLQKLEAVAFDADKVFDELNYDVLRKKAEETNTKTMKQVRSLFSPSNPIVFRHRMARKIKHINEEMKLINQKASELGLQMRIAGVHAAGVGADLQTDSFTVDPVFVGRVNDVTNIVEMVTSSTFEQVISVIPIVGMGGLGKTTLARKVYNDRKITSHFGERIWVHVSEVFDPVIVLKGVVESVSGENVDGSREVLLKKLQQKLGNKTYLLVLDSVWNEDTEKWDNFITSLKGISLLIGNAIIVTTRSENVASIVKTIDVYPLGVLSEEDCWLIIKARAFPEGSQAEFETRGKHIAKRCQGLPLAAKVVGSLLRGRSNDVWLSIERKWLADFGGDENMVSKILKLSFDMLSSPSLKKCFAYCSVFPKGSLIGREELIELWMAEGFLQANQENDMEIMGNKALNLLVQSSLLQVVCYRNAEYCSMHDLVHDLALSVLTPKFSDDIHRVRYEFPKSLRDEPSVIQRQKAKHLRTLLFNGQVSHIIFSEFKCLHSLILHGEDIKELPILIGKLIHLRYLDISYTRIEYLPDSIGELYNFQTLRATREHDGGSHLRKLPDTSKYLISMRHLHIPNIDLPPYIGSLTCLQTLPYFSVDNEKGRAIVELGKLKNLKGGLVISNLEKVRDKEEAKSADLRHKENILMLKLVWNGSRDGGTNDENVLEGLEPHSNLKSLEINGFKSRDFPLWAMRMYIREEHEGGWIKLHNLMEIKLSSCEECEQIPMLGHLPHLKSLYLHHLINVKYIGSSFYGIEENTTIAVFPKLERLELKNMQNLTTWSEVELPSSSESINHEVSVFCRLEHLKVIDCRKLNSAPSHFPSLKELEIDNMESELPLANICGSKLTSLTQLTIWGVDGLMRLPDGLFNNNRDLLTLDVMACNNLTCLGDVGASLRKLVIDTCRDFVELPHDLPNLNAVIDTCRDFVELPHDLPNLNALEELTIYGCPNLKSIPYPSVGDSSSPPQGLTSLRRLGIEYCSGLTNLPSEMIESCVPSLERFSVTGSKNIANLPQLMGSLQKMPSLKELKIGGVPEFTNMAAEIASIRSLKSLQGVTLTLSGMEHLSNSVMSSEDFNERVDDFIRRFSRNLRLERIRSFEKFREFERH